MWQTHFTRNSYKVAVADLLGEGSTSLITNFPSDQHEVWCRLVKCTIIQVWWMLFVSDCIMMLAFKSILFASYICDIGMHQIILMVLFKIQLSFILLMVLFKIQLSFILLLSISLWSKQESHSEHLWKHSNWLKLLGNLYCWWQTFLFLKCA